MSAQLSVGIIGAWLGGLALGILLSRSDFHGGTWWMNTYPGLACDVKSHLYSALDRQRR